MRAYIRGPSIGPVHTVLWSSGHRRQRTPYKGRLLLYFTACLLTGWAFTIAGPLGWAALALFFALPAVVYVIRAARETPGFSHGEVRAKLLKRSAGSRHSA